MCNHLHWSVFISFFLAQRSWQKAQNRPRENGQKIWCGKGNWVWWTVWIFVLEGNWWAHLHGMFHEYSGHQQLHHWLHMDALVRVRHNSRALAMELCLSCTNPSIWSALLSPLWRDVLLNLNLLNCFKDYKRCIHILYDMLDFVQPGCSFMAFLVSHNSLKLFVVVFRKSSSLRMSVQY